MIQPIFKLDRILCKIPTSVQINDKILHNDLICQKYIYENTLILKKASLFFGEENPFTIKNSLLPVDITALEGCNILHNFANTPKYPPKNPIEKHISFFLKSNLTPNLMNYDSIYNRCYSFLEALYLDTNLSIESNLIEYITTEELPYLKKAPLTSSMGNDILRLTALYLFGRQFSDCVAQKISVELLLNLLLKNIDTDCMLPTSIENMFYYTSLLTNFRSILMCPRSSIENNIDKLIYKMEKICCLLTDRGVFPAVGTYKNKKRTSPFPEIKGFHCFNEQGYFVFSSEKNFFFLKSTGTAPNSHADANSIVYRYDSIDILTEFGSGNSTTFAEQEESPIAHTMPVHRDYVLNVEDYKSHFNYKKSKIKHTTESTDGFEVITESTFDDISITRHFKLSNNILQLEDYIDGDYRKYCSVFNIPSMSTDISIDKNIVTYNVSGLNIKISASNGVAWLKTYYECRNTFYSILFTTSSNLPIQYFVTIDDSERNIFLNEQQAFLNPRIFSAVHRCLENPFVENLLILSRSHFIIP